MPVSILERLRGLPESQWMTSPPATPESLLAIERKYKLRLPGDYRELMQVTNGFGLYGHRTQLNLEPADELFWHNEDPRFTAKLPGMFVIGDDNGDALFYYDPTNRLGKGIYAIFQVDFGMIGFPHSKHAAASLSELIEAILANEEIWEYPYLGPLDHPDRAE
jgi:hypothetical protein